MQEAFTPPTLSARVKLRAASRISSSCVLWTGTRGRV
jgi:hypothetical protein